MDRAQVLEKARQCVCESREEEYGAPENNFQTIASLWGAYLSRCIKQAPTIEAVPVVRCKECEDYNTIGCSKGFGWCESMGRGVSDDFYCANGAKMESEVSR